MFFFFLNVPPPPSLDFGFLLIQNREIKRSGLNTVLKQLRVNNICLHFHDCIVAENNDMCKLQDFQGIAF